MSSKTVAKKIVSVKKSLADKKTVAAKPARGASKKVAPAKKLDTLELFVQTYARF